MTPPPAVAHGAVMGLALLEAVLSSDDHGALPLTLAVLAALALGLRRRWPYLTLALTLPALISAYVLIAPMVALYTIAFTVRDWRILSVCAAPTAAGYYLPWPPTDLDWDSDPSDFLGLIYTAALVGAPLALGLLVRTRRDLTDRLADLQAGREREQRLLAEQVLAEERGRLAREMHDAVSHQVSLIAIQIGALQVVTNDDAVRDIAATIRQLSVRTLTELRQMVGVLRTGASPPVELAPQPRLADIPRLVHDSGQNAAVDIDQTSGRPWPEPVERAAYRLVQEALTNTGKHAPGAEVTITVRPAGTDLIVTVRNGPATGTLTPAPPGGGHGLLGLRERAEHLGGSFHAGPTPAGGFELEATLPAAAPPSLGHWGADRSGSSPGLPS